MANRNTLHVKKLDAFKGWLDNNGFAHRAGKGPYQVLQVQTDRYGWQVIFRRDSMPEHYSINDKLTYLVQRFLDESK